MKEIVVCRCRQGDESIFLKCQIFSSLEYFFNQKISIDITELYVRDFLCSSCYWMTHFIQKVRFLYETIFLEFLQHDLILNFCRKYSNVYYYVLNYKKIFSNWKYIVSNIKCRYIYSKYIPSNYYPLITLFLNILLFFSKGTNLKISK